MLSGISLVGKRVLVTGVSAGLGVETARALVAHGAEVVGAVRDLSKAAQATKDITVRAGDGGGLSLVELDLASLLNVQCCSETLLEDGRPFDLIIANAGIMATPEGRTADGFERQFGTNHLGHFLLINRLAPLLNSDSRVVILSSAGHGFANIDLDDPNFERTPYDPWIAYGRSKTANALFAVEFDRRHRAAGIRATAVHPGAIHTDLGRHMTPETTAVMVAAMGAAQSDADGPLFKFKTIPQGAATSVWASVVAEAELVGGRYCEDCGVAEIKKGTGVGAGVKQYALDPETAKALWAMSEKMIGEGSDIAGDLL